MHALTTPRLSKIPFFLADALMLGVAAWIVLGSKGPLDVGSLCVAAGCVALGALAGLLPFVLEYRAAVKVAEAGALTTVMSQMQQLETLNGEIKNATARWQTVQEESTHAVAAAREIGERMTVEAKAFGEFMQRANDQEKGTLRLEVEKLRRAEGEWLQICVRMLDHIYALNQAAARSGRPELIEQLGNFQNACREAARRVGLVPFAPAEAEAYDPQRHQVLDGGDKEVVNGVVAEAVAAGYTLQGRLVRPALVRLKPPSSTGETTT